MSSIKLVWSSFFCSSNVMKLPTSSIPNTLESSINQNIWLCPFSYPLSFQSAAHFIKLFLLCIRHDSSFVFPQPLTASGSCRWRSSAHSADMAYFHDGLSPPLPGCFFHQPPDALSVLVPDSRTIMLFSAVIHQIFHIGKYLKKKMEHPCLFTSPDTVPNAPTVPNVGADIGNDFPFQKTDKKNAGRGAKSDRGYRSM